VLRLRSNKITNDSDRKAPAHQEPCASADCNLMRPFPADLMRMWPISTRVNKPENDDSSIIEPIELESA
jgi:putative SOS response-associated peptidase YedK